MGPHSHLIAKWQAWTSRGYDVDILNPARLQAGSVCAFNECLVDSPGGSTEWWMFFESLGDFVAFLRYAQLPFDLSSVICDDGEESRCVTSAEQALGGLDAQHGSRLEECLAELDRISAGTR